MLLLGSNRRGVSAMAMLPVTNRYAGTIFFVPKISTLILLHQQPCSSVLSNVIFQLIRFRKGPGDGFAKDCCIERVVIHPLHVGPDYGLERASLFFQGNDALALIVL